MIRQWAASRLLRLRATFDHRGDNRRGDREPLALVLFDCLDGQLELLSPV
jgi:hypothetical protein